MYIMRYTRTKNVIPLSSNGLIVFCIHHLRHGKHVKKTCEKKEDVGDNPPPVTAWLPVTHFEDWHVGMVELVGGVLPSDLSSKWWQNLNRENSLDFLKTPFSSIYTFAGGIWWQNFTEFQFLVTELSKSPKFLKVKLSHVFAHPWKTALPTT